MSSSYLPNFSHNFISQHPPHTTQHYHDHLSTPHATYPSETDYILYEEATQFAIAQLSQNVNNCMSEQFNAPNPNISIDTSTSLPPTFDARQDSVISAVAPSVQDWQMYPMSMGGGPVAGGTPRPLKRQKTHQRTPSASTIASNGPASPYTGPNTSYPFIANTDYDPQSPAYYADQASISKNLPQKTPTDNLYMHAGYVPSQVAHTPNAHLAMKEFAIGHHMSDEFPPEFYQSSRHSMSSGHDSPATPQSGVGENIDPKNFNFNQNDYKQPNHPVQFFRTESQAYQDELYNPPTYTSTPVSATRRNADYLSPHRNLVNERLQTANLARSASPTSAISRERSPFRDGSPYAAASEWQASGQPVGTAAGMRQRQKEEAEQAEYAQHVPSLHREPTKTISPKDAVLDYAESGEPSLFQDNVPAGYKQHTGGTENWQTNFSTQAGSSFGTLVAPGTHPQQMNPFRATSADNFDAANLASWSLPPNESGQSSEIQGNFHDNSYAAPKMSYTEATPHFPPNLVSMESSVSEGGPPPSSQDSYNTSAAHRPSDTRANTGTYTCTYHGCTHRFDSHINLQKHKRDYHRAQQQRDTSVSAGTDSTSARSTESPAPSGSGMTSAAILARNSQAGPHKCTRINPSTNKPCNTIFSRPYDLTRHEDTIHNNRKQKVRCPMCREEKTFSRNDALTRHMRVVHPEVESFGKRPRRGE